MSCTGRTSQVDYHSVDSDGVVHSGSVQCRTLPRGELLAVEQVLSLHGPNIVLYTTSDYVCSVFNLWAERWLSNGYTTRRGGTVCNSDVICRMISKDCMLAEYVPVSLLQCVEHLQRIQRTTKQV